MEVGEAIGLLMTESGRVDPYPTYAALREHGPLVTVDAGFYVATGHAALDELLRDQRMRVPDRAYWKRLMPDFVPDRALSSIGRSMLQVNGADHSRMRRLASGAFTARRVAALRPAVHELAAALIDRLAESDGPVDFMSAVAFPLPVGVICALLGVPAADQDWFRGRASALTVILEPALVYEEPVEANAAVAELEEYFTALVAQRRAEPRDDLTTALVQAHESDGAALTADELLANLILLLVAGFETTTNLLGNGLVTLLRHPDQARRLRDDPELAERFVTEMLRHDSPVQLTSRWTPEDTTIAGQTIQAYGQVLMLLGAGNHDPARFTDPGTFDPDREPNQPLSFGGGVHYCLGAPLARLEAQVAFPLLLARLPELALAGDPVRRDRLTLRGYAEVPVVAGRPA